MLIDDEGREWHVTYTGALALPPIWGAHMLHAIELGDAEWQALERHATRHLAPGLRQTGVRMTRLELSKQPVRRAEAPSGGWYVIERPDGAIERLPFDTDSILALDLLTARE